MRLETIQGTLRVLDEKMSELTQINLM